MTRFPPQLWIGAPAVAFAVAAMMAAPFWACPWIVAAALYALFLSHYKNWRGPLTAAEIEGFLAASQHESDLEGYRAFLEADDGREFFMLNLVRFADCKVSHPDSGEQIAPYKLVEQYTRPFIRKLMLHGGHPTMLLLRRGDDVDAWGPTAEMGARWEVTNVMRYRSRRDLAILASAADFEDIHRYKRDAIVETISFPNKALMSGFAGPRQALALALTLGAAIAHIAILTLI